MKKFEWDHWESENNAQIGEYAAQTKHGKFQVTYNKAQKGEHTFEIRIEWNKIENPKNNRYSREYEIVNNLGWKVPLECYEGLHEFLAMQVFNMEDGEHTELIVDGEKFEMSAKKLK